MAEDKKKELSPIEVIEQRHAASTRERAARLAALHKDLKAAEQLVRDTKAAISVLQQENIRASFAYDDARRDLKAKKAA